MWKTVHNNIYLVVLVGDLLALTGDSTVTWSSPVLPKLSSNDSSNPLPEPITENEQSWITSLLYIGTIIGILPGIFLSDKIGRKPTLLILSLPHIVAFLLFAFAQNITLFYVGRVFSGISLCAVYAVLPIYFSEISPDSQRGTFLMSYNVSASFGNLIPYIIGPYLSLFWYNIILTIFPAIFFIFCIILAPESPYYLVAKKRDNDAREFLLKFQKDESEIEEIKKEVEETQSDNFWESVKKRHVIKGFVLSTALASFAQLSGVSAVLGYTEIIFNQVQGNLSADISSIIVGLLLFAGSICSIFLIDKKGRRFLVFISLSGIILSEVTLGIYFILQDQGKNISAVSWLPVLCIVVFSFSYIIGIGPIPYIIWSEVLPANVKFTLATIGGSTSWMFSFLVSRFFLDLNNSIGRGQTFFLFAGFSAVALVFSYYYLPETRGKSFLEIQELLAV